MKEILLKIYNRFVQIIVRLFCRVAGSGGKFAKLLIPGQTYLINNYCGNLNLQVDTSYPTMISFETLPIFYETTLHNIKTIYEFLEGLGYKIIRPTKPHS